ncbi:flagellar basal body-associated FliL family protein [uncultured Sulfitobacter sp.]|uniref:flagellar basal body-associated FliL family protein n=1 Tax=uncultured Sulfitobacter sp. TaxID=191468 RepID=UPI002639E88C|nr:flagellar basal body-associated FliL family protein [uncultured Sulfitobacter sp.]
MLKKIFPLVLLLVGTGAGVGAGVFLRPAVSDSDDAIDGGAPEQALKQEDIELGAADEADAKAVKPEHSDTKTAASEGAQSEYVKMNNQFVVPIVADDRVAAMVVLALSIEVPSGMSDIVFRREPKLRDSFLQVLFDHANMGGFDGAFTSAEVLGRLRTALREVAEKDLGRDVARDILIVEIARQDY